MSQGIQPLSDPELVAGPELVRVSVLGGNTQFDVGLPAGVQIAALIPELLSHIRSRSSGHPGSASGVDDDDHDGTAFRPHLWTLSMIGGEDLPAEVTLSESGVRDGELLVLQSRKSGAAPPLFDDVIDAVARLGEERTSQWSATTARYAGYAAAVAFSLLTALALLVADHPGSGWPLVVAAAACLVLLVASGVVGGVHRDAATSIALLCTTLPQAMAAGMLAVPGVIGRADIGLGCVVVLAVVVISYRVTGAGALCHSAATTAAVLGGTACGAALLTDASPAEVGAVTAVCAAAAVALAPRLTIVLAKLPLPPVPTAGGAGDLVDHEPSPTIEGIGAVGAMALPDARTLERRVALAESYLTGILTGAALVTVTATVVSVSWHTSASVGPLPVTAILATVISAVLCLRGRSHSGLAPAAILIGAGILGWLGVLSAMLFTTDPAPAGVVVAGLVTVVVATAIGVVATAHEFSPVMRRAVEIGEYVLVASIVPLLLWILDLYQSVRNL
ncbi:MULTISPECIES: type VII secretion integral membrane protein EccD [Gordonia]|uniref:type VII secretion integral membrane protein EccD n=1 Tax=Gordonia TaxID=2053 RepID=UPI001FE7FD06|nr:MULTISPECIES: type VII secretion integral membrane protein EccD [Gordonia]